MISEYTACASAVGFHVLPASLLLNTLHSSKGTPAGVDVRRGHRIDDQS
jgi:hypothetical protein